MHNIRRIFKLCLIILYLIVFIGNISYGLLSILAICIHELFHILFLKFNDVKSFKFSVLGFRIDLDHEKFINREIILYMVGSLANIIVGVICLFIKNIYGNEILHRFMIVNFVIGFVNLIPAFPLDGAIIFKNILFSRLRQNIAVFISIFMSLFVAMIIFIFNVSLMLEFSFINITYIVIIIFIFISTYKEYKLFISTFLVNKIEHKKYMFFKKKYNKSSIICVSYNIKLLELMKLYKFSRFLVFYFMDDELKIIGVMNEYNVLECYKKFGNIEIREYYKK